MREVNDDDLMTVQRFAEMYRVDASVVRRWVKEGRTDYELVGPRKLRRVRVSAIVKPVEPRVNNRLRLTMTLTAQGMDEQTAKDVVASMDQESVDAEVNNQEPQHEQQRAEAGGPGGGTGRPSPGTSGAGASSNQAGRAKGDAKPARPAAKDTKGKGRGGRTA